MRIWLKTHLTGEHFQIRNLKREMLNVETTGESSLLLSVLAALLLIVCKQAHAEKQQTALLISVLSSSSLFWLFVLQTTLTEYSQSWLHEETNTQHMTLMLRLRPGHGAQIYGYLNAFYQNYIIYMRAQNCKMR